jgi:hypothetical protein
MHLGGSLGAAIGTRPSHHDEDGGGAGPQIKHSDHGDQSQGQDKQGVATQLHDKKD